MSAFQNMPWETNLYLSLGGVPATGITYNQVTVKYKKFGATAFTTRTLISGDLAELGSGFYTLKWAATYTNILGTLLYVPTGVAFDNFIYDTFDVEPQPVALYAPPQTCIVSGNVVDIGGAPAHNARISFRAPEFPVIVGNSVVDSRQIYTLPDAFGNFSILLMQGQTVIVEVERSGIYNQITIPYASSATLVSLLPPPPV